MAKNLEEFLMSVSWEELRRSIKEVIREEKELENSKPNVSEITTEHACSCPDCYCNIIKEMNRKSDYICQNCGLPLGDKAFAEKIEKCPNCGSKEAKKVEREWLF